jgi:arabinose-5-phosphate isomerase
MKEKIERLSNAFLNIIDKKETSIIINHIKKNIDNGIIISGLGKNWFSSLKASKTFTSIGIKCNVLDPVHALHGDIGIVKNDFIFFVSKSGKTVEVTNLIKYILELRKREIINPFLISLTLNKENDINNLCDICICPDVEIFEMDELNLIPTFSVILFQMYLDYVAVKLLYKNEIKEKIKINHPGGNIGSILKQK